MRLTTNVFLAILNHNTLVVVVDTLARDIVLLMSLDCIGIGTMDGSTKVADIDIRAIRLTLGLDSCHEIAIACSHVSIGIAVSGLVLAKGGNELSIAIDLIACENYLDIRIAD